MQQTNQMFAVYWALLLLLAANTVRLNDESQFEETTINNEKNNKIVNMSVKAKHQRLVVDVKHT